MAATHEQTERARLAEVIERRGDDIIERWLGQITEDAATRNVSLSDLKDGIHDYLRRLSALLRAGEPLDTYGATTWGDIAREHALTRVQLGFDVTELVHELVVLRRATNAVMKEEGCSDSEQVERVLLLIDDAMKSTIQSYINFRDFQSRRIEAEHIGFLTHELKNPLTAAILAVDQLHPAPSPLHERLLGILERNLQRIRRTVDDILLTERLGVGEVESKPVDVPLRQLIEEPLVGFAKQANAKHVAFKSDYDPAIIARLDPSLTLSAIENLVDNAIKFTDSGTVSFVVEESAGELVFHVYDSCSGLSRAELRVIFEPFKRAHSTKPGSGLGLAIAKRAVEAQGGTMHAESSEETGCHFWFELPKTHH